MSAAGATMFARFAYPPNLLGYCGPADTESLLAYGSGRAPPDRGLEQLARGFEGAWPYLELLAGAAGTDDPLHARVVEAYWIGNDLLDRVDDYRLGWHLSDRFGPRCGSTISSLTGTIGDGAAPNHAFHVFGVYPWVGLLREGRGGAEPLRVVDRCRIRWGRVVEADATTALVRSAPLVWADGLSLGTPAIERVAIGLERRVSPGDVVAMHWDWVCERLDTRQLARLQRTTASQLVLANRTSSPLIASG